MWNDEDNNPYGTSFARSEEEPSSPESPQCTSFPPLAAAPTGEGRGRVDVSVLTCSRPAIRRPRHPELDRRQRATARYTLRQG